MKEVRARTVCVRCGAQPIDFHREEHVAHPTWRVPILVTGGVSPARIQREIDLCTPLCRRCHMTVDGRLERLKAARYITPTVPPRPCRECERMYKPLRKGFCPGCYDTFRKYVRPRLLLAQ